MVGLAAAPPGIVVVEPAKALDESIASVSVTHWAGAKLATEYLILGVDPHPRKPGIAFDAPKAEDAAEGSPFAALAALKKGTVKE